MRLVIDTNRIISALLKESTSREIIMNRNFEFLTPDYTLEEMQKYKGYICKKAGINEETFEILVSLLFERIDIMPSSEYEKHIKEAKTLIADIKDVPFIACSLAFKTDGIWSDDEHFQQQSKVKVFRTEELTRYL